MRLVKEKKMIRISEITKCGGYEKCEVKNTSKLFSVTSYVCVENKLQSVSNRDISHRFEVFFFWEC